MYDVECVHAFWLVITQRWCIGRATIINQNLLMAPSGKVSFEDFQMPWLETWFKMTQICLPFHNCGQVGNSFLTTIKKKKKNAGEWKYIERKNLILWLYYFQMRKKFTKVWFTAIRKTNYKYMYNDRYSHFVPDSYFVDKLGRPCVPSAIYQESASKLSWFWRRKY